MPVARAAIAWLGGSAGSAAASCLTPAPIGPVGAANSVSGSATPAAFAPTASGGRVAPTETTRSGSGPVASSQRPIQPVVAGWSGEPLCQMSIERKWLWSGFG